MNNSNIFDRLSFVSLFLVVVLLPIFCLPFTNFPIEISKGLLLVVGLAACIIFWAIARFIDGKVIFPKSYLLASGFGIVLVFLLSALFSGTPQVSLFGTMFDVGSFYFIFSAFLLMLCSSVVFRNPKRAKMVLLGTILSSAVLLVFQIVHLFFPANTNLWGILADKTSNILGSWSALGLFAGFSGLIFLLMIEFFPISKMEKILLGIFLFLLLLLTTAINFSLVWILLGISSLVIFVYKVSINFQINEGEEKKHFPIISLVIMMISLLFFLNPLISLPKGPIYFDNIIPSYLGVQNTEVNPTFPATMSVTGRVLVHHPILGIGPNKFATAWAMYKPSAINNTQFWDTSFDSGSGLLPTLASTTGGLGILSLLVFLVLFLITGTKSVFSSIKNGVNWEKITFFVLSLYLFVSLFFYSSGSVMFLLAFAFTGTFVGLITSSPDKEISVLFLNDHRKSFFSILALIFIIIFSVAGLFKYIERFSSISYFGKTIQASTVPVAEDSINKALSLYVNDLYLRTYAQVYLLDLNSIVKKSTPLSDADKANLQTTLDLVVKGAQAAVSFNPSNYLNSQLLGSIYQEIGSLGVKDSYSKAVSAYQDASNLNPLNPGFKLAMGNAAFSDGKVQDAKDYANAALSLKPDYVDAYIFLSQVALSENDNTSALNYAQTALSITPNDPNLIKYVQSLKNPTSSSTKSTSAPVTTKKK